MARRAIQSYDWTVLQADGRPVQSCRGVDGTPGDVRSLVTGFEPALLKRTNVDGASLLAPYNLITTFYWVYEDARGNERPVRLAAAATDLLGSRGGRIAASLLEFMPAELSLEPGEQRDITIAVTVPAEATRGCYSGLLVVRGVDDLRALMTIEVV